MPAELIHRFFLSLNNKQVINIILLFGLILFVFSPLLSIIPLLLYCQIKTSKIFVKNYRIGGEKRTFNQNNFSISTLSILVLVLLIVIIYNANIVVYGDTLNYIKVYQDLVFNNVDYVVKRYNQEPLMYVIPKIVAVLTNGSQDWFLFSQSLIFNSIILIYSIYFFPGLFPLVFLINLLTPGYFSQMFLMRQYFSFIFIIPLIFSRNWISVILLSIASYYTHRISAIIILLLIPGKIFIWLSTKFFSKRNIRKRFISLAIFFTIFVVGIFLIRNLSVLYTSLIQFDSNLSSDNTEYYASYVHGMDERGEFNIKRVFIHMFFFTTIFYYFIYFKVDNKLDEKLSQYYSNIKLAFISYFIIYISSFLFNLTGRLYYFVTALPGFFWFIIFFSTAFSFNFRYQPNSINNYSLLLTPNRRVKFSTRLPLGVLCFQIFYFVYRQVSAQFLINASFQDLYAISGAVIFWNNESLTTSIVSYFIYLFNLFVEVIPNL